jgi:tRNA pseudouridine38-40 synthase
MKVAYEGTAYAGFQIQPDLPTIQGELERAVGQLTGQRVSVLGSGRTDAGVHANGQVVQMLVDSRIPLERWPLAMNALLPEDIRVMKAAEVPPGFHVRHDVIKKTYLYRVNNCPHQDPFLRRISFHYPRRLDQSRMEAAARMLEGTHDFTSFCSVRTAVENRVRTIYRLEPEQASEGFLFWVTGNGFLYNMVRILVGTLLEVGTGKRDPGEMTTVLKSRDRTRAGMTAPAHGLTMWQVEYERDYF